MSETFEKISKVLDEVAPSGSGEVDMTVGDKRNPFHNPAIADGYASGWNNRNREVTRLQAENSALQQRLTIADQLNDDLQSELTKARELLSEVCDSIANPDHYRKVFAYLDPSARAAKPSLQADEIHQMAFEEGQPAENGDGYLFTAEEFDLFVERLLTSQSAPAAKGDRYECIGKGCDYQVVAIAQGAGTLKGFNHYVYKNADGVHFVREPDDFLSRMQVKPAAKDEGGE